LAFFLQDRKHQFLFAQPAGVVDLKAHRQINELCHMKGF